MGTVDPYDGGYSIPVQAYRVLGVSQVNDDDVEAMLSICIIQLSAAARVPSLDWPFGRRKHGNEQLFAFGFGSTIPNRHYMTNPIQAAQFTPVADPTKRECVFNRIYMKLRLTDVSDDYNFYCMKPGKAKLSLYDSGAPLIDKDTFTIYGTAVTVFPNSTNYDQMNDLPAVFLPILPHQKVIEKALWDMEKEFDEEF